MNYYSEHKQDLWLSENIFKDKVNGTFVEFGAIDGLLHSNTLFWELNMGWNGVCIEPNPENYALLKNNRRCKCFNYAVGDNDCMVDFEVFKGGLCGWSGVSEYIEPGHRDRIEKHIPEQLRSIVKVQMKTLNYILDEAQIKEVDYMSIDTEGSEYAILKAFDFNRFNVKVFDVENNFKTFPFEKLMNENGYKKLITLDINDIYVRV